MRKQLGVGIVGGGSKAHSHLRAWTGVRDAAVLGVWSPDRVLAAEAAGLARRLDIGAAKPYPSITAMVADPAIDALWLCGPDSSRVENMEEIADAIIRAKGEVVGLACETPLARNVADAQRVAELAAHAGVKHGYLENQVFVRQVAEGKSLLWAGPRKAWVWRGDLQDGARLNDLLCHSTLIVRFLLAPPGTALAAVRPKRVTCRIADHAAHLTIEFVTAAGRTVVAEATASWSPAEYTHPEYSLSWNPTDGGLKVLLNCDVKGTAGAATDGYEAEDRHFVRAFLGLEEPLLTFEDGLDVVRLLMTAYTSAAVGQTLDYPPAGLETLAPALP